MPNALTHMVADAWPCLCSTESQKTTVFGLKISVVSLKETLLPLLPTRASRVVALLTAIVPTLPFVLTTRLPATWLPSDSEKLFLGQLVVSLVLLSGGLFSLVVTLWVHIHYRSTHAAYGVTIPPPERKRIMFGREP